MSVPAVAGNFLVVGTTAYNLINAQEITLYDECVAIRFSSHNLLEVSKEEYPNIYKNLVHWFLSNEVVAEKNICDVSNLYLELHTKGIPEGSYYTQKNLDNYLEQNPEKKIKWEVIKWKLPSKPEQY